MPSLLDRAIPQDTVSSAPPDLTPEDQAVLLRIARSALAVATGALPPESLSGRLRETRQHRVAGHRAAAFVTLFEDGDLRGCMGALEPLRPLPHAVADAALRAALDDPRFWPLQPAELATLNVEISVLGQFAQIADPGSIRVGTDGVMVESAGLRGLLLPQVATDMGWDGPQLWSAVCDKAGLPEDAWRDPTTRLLTFQTVRFSGPARTDPTPWV